MKFQKHILTREHCDALGHVAWIEDNNPISAIQRMRATVSEKPINCAIWANSYTAIGDSVVDAIEEWRSKFSYTFSGDHFKPPTPDELPSFIRRAFARATRKTVAKLEIEDSDRADFITGISALESFVIQRSDQIREAMQPALMSMRPKVSSRHDTVFDTPNLHVDYPNKRVQFRFLDAIRCPHTILASNEDVKPSGNDDGRYKYKDAVANGLVDVFECPANSLILLPQSDCNPIVHSQPFICEKGQENVPRTTATYDIVCP